MGWCDQYIPDLTERFPEGFGGVDLTDSFFPSSGCDCYDAWEALEREYYENERRYANEDNV